MNCALTFEPLPYLVAIYHFQSLTAKGYELVSGGTDNHLVLVNLKSKVKTNMWDALGVLRYFSSIFQFLLWVLTNKLSAASF